MKYALAILLALCACGTEVPMSDAPRGLNTEVDPQGLPSGSHPQFSRVAYRGGAVRPIASHGTYATPAGLELWKFQGLATRDFVPLPQAGDDPFYAYVARAGGSVAVRNTAGSFTAAPLTLPAPTAAPDFSGFSRQSGAVRADHGLDNGASRTYVAAWANSSTGAHSGLGPTVEVTNSAYEVTFSGGTDGGSGLTPAVGDTISNGAASATINQVYKTLGTWAGGTAGGIIVYSATAGFADTDSLTITREATAVASATAAGDEVAVDNAYVRFAPPDQAVPAGADRWVLYALDASGYYYEISSGAAASALVDSEIFPDDYSNYDGPLTDQELPETLLHLPDVGNAQALAVHKECLFVAIGEEIYISEPTEHHWFRSGAALHAGGTILAMVPVPTAGDSLVQVFTDQGFKYIIGNPPNFEIRDTGINEAPASRRSITPSDVGTWVAYDDGIYLFQGVQRTNITRGNNTDWMEAIADPTATIGGASKGKYRLADATGRMLVYDWETQQFYEDALSAQPAGFLYSDSSRLLVALIDGAYKTMEGGTGQVSWTVEYPTSGSVEVRATPGGVSVLGEGEWVVDYFVDDVEVASYALNPEDEPDNYLRLPTDRGCRWRVVVSGLGTMADTVLRQVRFGR